MPTLNTFGEGSARGFGLTTTSNPVALYWAQVYGVPNTNGTPTTAPFADGTKAVYNAGNANTYNQDYVVLLKYDFYGNFKYQLLLQLDDRPDANGGNCYSYSIDSYGNVYLGVYINGAVDNYVIVKLNNSNSSNPLNKNIIWTKTLKPSDVLTVKDNKIVVSNYSIVTLLDSSTGDILLSKNITPTFSPPIVDKGYINQVYRLSDSSQIITSGTSTLYNGSKTQYDGLFLRLDSTGSTVLNEVRFGANDIAPFNASPFYSAYTYDIASTGADIVYIPSLIYRQYSPSNITARVGLIKYNYTTNTIVWQKGYDPKSNGFAGNSITYGYVKVDSQNNVYTLSQTDDASYHQILIILKFDSNGNLLWQNKLRNSDNPSDTYLMGFNLDKNNDLVVGVQTGYPSISGTIKLPGNGTIPATIQSPWVYEQSTITIIDPGFSATTDVSATTSDYDPSDGTITTFTEITEIPPTADFYASSPTYGPAPLTVEFTDASTGGPTSWAWDFDNSGTIDSTLQNPTYVYNTPGLYSVKLTVSNGGGSNSVTITDYINVL